MRHLNALEQKFGNDKFAGLELGKFEVRCTLLDFASGHSKATDIAAEMADFVATSSWIPDMSNNPMLMHMHRRLFRVDRPRIVRQTQSIAERYELSK